MRDVRKVVTVLFCDLAGYTSTGDRLDPEALRAIQSKYFEDARAALERHGGMVEKFIGDAVMAVFGIPTLHEDDALRALRAATELRDAVTALGFQARIGVNTGEVVAGRGDALVTGDAVNVAARLEQAAEPGEILLGRTTLRLVRDAVEVEAVEPLELKGKADAVAAHRLLRVVEGAPAFERRLDAPFVGRRDELARVRTAFDEALSDRTCHLVTAFGPPGIGKTRLAREVATSLSGDADVLVGRCLPYGEGITYWPLAEIYRQAHADDEWGTAVEAGSPEDVAWTVRKWLETRARARPLTLVFEDIHWAEPPLLDLIEHVVDWSRDAPMLLFCLARPDLHDARAGWSGEAITLEPLTDEESDELIESLLGETTLDEAGRSRIREVAEGNPLFVEQLLAMLADGAPPDEVPATIQALLAARLDGLPDEEREIVERASVVGLDFEWEALGELAPDRRRPAGAQLAALVRKELIRPHEAIDDTFRFRHILIRDAAYERIPKSQRADLHERFAGWLDGRGEEFEEIIGYHLEQAHGYLIELGLEPDRGRALAEEAAGHLGSSGRRAYARGDMSAASDLIGRAVTLLPHGDLGRLRLLPVLGRVLIDQGEWQRAAALLDEAVEQAEGRGEDTIAADASLARLYIWFHTDVGATHNELRHRLDDALRALEAAGDSVGLAHGLQFAGQMRFWRGDSEGGIADLERAAVFAQEAGDQALEAEILRSALVAARHGSATAGATLARVDDAGRRMLGNKRLDVTVLATRAYVIGTQGDFESARSLFLEATSLAEEFGLERTLTEVLYQAAEIELLAGDPVAAEHFLRPACEALESMENWGHYVSYAPELVESLFLQGRVHDAVAPFELISQHLIEDDADAQIGVHRCRVRFSMHAGNLVESERYARESVAIAARTDYLDFHARALADLAEVLRSMGRQAEAAAALDQAISLCERKGNVARERKLRAVVAELAAQPPATA